LHIFTSKTEAKVFGLTLFYFRLCGGFVEIFCVGRFKKHDAAAQKTGVSAARFISTRPEPY
jgi:hypothetical protein